MTEQRLSERSIFEAAIDRSEFRSRLVRDLLDLFGGSPRLLVSNLLETGTITLKDLKALESEAPHRVTRRGGGKHDA